MSADHEPRQRKPTEADSASQNEREEPPTQSTRSHTEILYLQRTLGNRAVARMLKPSSQANKGQIQRGDIFGRPLDRPAPSIKFVEERSDNHYDIEVTWEDALEHEGQRHTIVAHLHIRPPQAAAAPAGEVINGAGIWISGKQQTGINWKNIPDSGAFKDYLAAFRR